jgi:two-component system sensor histidine kinase EvgS
MIIFVSFQFLKKYRLLPSNKNQLISDLEMHHYANKISSEKSDFIATISHEIRNPLQAIIGTHELLIKDESISYESKSLIKGAYNTSKSLLNMLNQVLDLSKIESGKIELTQEPTCLIELLNDLIQSFQGLCDKSSNVLKIHLDPLIAPSLLINSTSLKQVLGNLISNAIKFTDHGTIFLSVNVMNDTHAEQLIQFQVIDTGCGIPEDDIGRIVHPYERSQMNHFHEIPGTGLGLSISSSLLRSMQSHLHLESKPHLGTSASFRLRLNRSSLSPISKCHDSKKFHAHEYKDYFLGKSALIVDDYPACRDVISQQLHYLGFHCIQADQANDGLLVLDKHHIDLVITDEFMPNINGRQFASMINKQYPTIKIMVLTGDSQFITKLNSEEITLISSFMIKPVELRELFEALKIIMTPNHLHWEFNHLLEFTNQNIVAAYTLLESVLQTQKELTQEIKTHLNQVNLSQLKPLCHKILGGAKLINAQYLMLHCQKIERSEEAIQQKQVRPVYQELIRLNHQIQRFLEKNHSNMI